MAQTPDNEIGNLAKNMRKQSLSTAAILKGLARMQYRTTVCLPVIAISEYESSRQQNYVQNEINEKVNETMQDVANAKVTLEKIGSLRKSEAYGRFTQELLPFVNESNQRRLEFEELKKSQKDALKSLQATLTELIRAETRPEQLGQQIKSTLEKAKQSRRGLAEKVDHFDRNLSHMGNRLLNLFRSMLGILPAQEQKGLPIPEAIAGKHMAQPD